MEFAPTVTPVDVLFVPFLVAVLVRAAWGHGRARGATVGRPTAGGPGMSGQGASDLCSAGPLVATDTALMGASMGRSRHAVHLLAHPPVGLVTLGARCTAPFRFTGRDRLRRFCLGLIAHGSHLDGGFRRAPLRSLGANREEPEMFSPWDRGAPGAFGPLEALRRGERVGVAGRRWRGTERT
jgi:hypothetical protein